jgi:tetratricopeptide (TPR) repeat protein
MSNARFRSLLAAGGFCLLVSYSSLAVDSTGTNAAASTTATNAETASSSDETLRAYLQLQEQIHEAQLAIERNRQESEEAATRSAKAVSDRLQVIEQSLAEQRASEQQAVQHANHTMLMVVSGFATLGCLAILLTAFLQWRAVNRFTSVSAIGNGLGPMRALPALEAGTGPLAALGPVEQSNVRLIGAIERLEKRIQELERVARPPLEDHSAASNILDLQSTDGSAATEPAESGAAGKESELTMVLGKGQSLLNLGKLEEALGCFDEVLARDPRNTDALVKKGTALERLRRPQEALECYDRAIAADNSMTIAYLYKGGLFNRMERFTEALQCYEQALHTQEKRRAS